jgi:hypothetical protein
MVPETAAAEPEATANTPWGMWTATEGSGKDVIVSQASLTTILEESRRKRVGKEIGQRDQSDFGRKA